MLHKFYVVVNHPDYKEEVHQELMSPEGVDPIPNRVVNCIDPMEDSDYNGVFHLTQEEADLLAGDLRVQDVHRSPEEIDVFLTHTGSRSGIFNKTYVINSNHKNWALSRCINLIENFGSNTEVTTPYTYNLDGTGVDIIVVDTGVESGHPEFAVNADGTGGSRVVDHDWTQYLDSFGSSYISAITGGFDGDCDGHGSNVASIAAGNTNGWASGAAIYSLRVIPSGKAGTPPETSIYDGRTLGLIPSELNVWRVIKAFHNSKTIDPNTGYKRPTVVNCSYSYYKTYQSISQINWRGTSFVTGSTSAVYGTLGTAQGNSSNQHGVRVSASDAEIQSCIDAGVIIVGAAGNNYHKIDILSGIDYNNYWTNTSLQTFYYHRGATPGSAIGVICVGASATSLPEHKINFSCAGPRVDIFAPGQAIMGAYSSDAYVSAAITDPRNSSYYQNKIAGTSQASPQIAGIVACILQARPWMTATNVSNFLKSVSIKGSLSETFYGGSGYTQSGGLQGGNNYLAYQPFNLPNQLKISG